MPIDVRFDEDRELLHITLSGAWPTLPEIVAERSRLILSGYIRPTVVELVDARNVSRGLPNLSQMKMILQTADEDDPADDRQPAEQTRGVGKLEHSVRRRQAGRDARSPRRARVSRGIGRARLAVPQCVGEDAQEADLFLTLQPAANHAGPAAVA